MTAYHTASTGGVRQLADFTLPSEPGHERRAIDELATAVDGLHLPASRLERLKTAVAEATMNAIEHGNANRAELPVHIEVLADDAAVTVRITDQGGGPPIAEPTVPDLEAKLAGAQSPRGWGLFLIRNMVDDLHVSSDGSHHTVELKLLREGEHDDPKRV